MGIGREQDRTCSVFPRRGFRAKGGPEIRREEVHPSGPYEQVADQLASRRKDHGQVSRKTNVLLDHSGPHNILDTIVVNRPK